MNYTEHRFPVFRAGVHTDSAGKVRAFTPADLDHIVSSYDPARHEAPVVIGHPEDNSPAFGWVRGLNHEDGTLYANADLYPDFERMVRDGLFKKRSISLYEDGTLRHIGFLGARPPAIKGLPDIRFHEGDATTIEFMEFTDSNAKKGGTCMKFMDWIRQLAGKEGVTIDDLPAAPGSFSEQRAEIQRQAADEVTRQVEAEKKRLEGEFAEARKTRDNELAAREEKIRAQEAEARKAGIAAFCEALQKAGTLTPAMMKTGMGMTNFLESIASIETPVSFGEAGKEAAQTPLEFMQTFLRGLPRAIEFKEFATGDKDAGAGGDTEKREKLISGYMEKNPSASYKDAVLTVSGENPALFTDR
jgi:hypothetical protein